MKWENKQRPFACKINGLSHLNVQQAIICGWNIHFINSYQYARCCEKNFFFMLFVCLFVAVKLDYSDFWLANAPFFRWNGNVRKLLLTLLKALQLVYVLLFFCFLVQPLLWNAEMSKIPFFWIKRPKKLFATFYDFCC